MAKARSVDPVRRQRAAVMRALSHREAARRDPHHPRAGRAILECRRVAAGRRAATTARRGGTWLRCASRRGRRRGRRGRRGPAPVRSRRCGCRLRGAGGGAAASFALARAAVPAPAEPRSAPCRPTASSCAPALRRRGVAGVGNSAGRLRCPQRVPLAAQPSHSAASGHRRRRFGGRSDIDLEPRPRPAAAAVIDGVLQRSRRAR